MIWGKPTIFGSIHICWLIFISLPLKPYALTLVVYASIPNDLSAPFPAEVADFVPKDGNHDKKSLPTTLLDLEKKTIWVQSLGGKTPGNPSVSNFLSFIHSICGESKVAAWQTSEFCSLFQRPHYFDKIRIQKFGTNIFVPPCPVSFQKPSLQHIPEPCLVPKGHHILPRKAHGKPTQVQKKWIIIRTWATKKTTILSSEGHCDYTEMFETRDFPTVSSFISTSNKSLRNRCGSWWPQGAAKRAATFVITCVIKELGVQIAQRSQKNIELQCNICASETYLNYVL